MKSNVYFALNKMSGSQYSGENGAGSDRLGLKMIAARKRSRLLSLGSEEHPWRAFAPHRINHNDYRALHNASFLRLFWPLTSFIYY
jgi:hypothetical protein